ncbi:MAG: hypothetical protein PHW10_01960 [Candidatus Peribacteraceae bacterium]|nr:hypothetical protein [Candidatus Peribacteraceae bacterium]
MVDSLGTLSSRSWDFFRSHLTDILLGALVAGIILGVLQTSVVDRMSQGARQGLERMGVDQERMEVLQQRMQAGDRQAAEELSQEMQRALGGLAEDGALNAVPPAVRNLFGGMMWSFLLFMAVATLVGVAFNGYVLVLVLEGKKAGDALSRLTGLLLPLVGLGLWLIVRTFVWIPVLGIVLAIILGPRFLLAPLLLVKEGKGVFASMRESYARTQGYWGKIFGNLFVISLLVSLAAMVVNTALGAVMGHASSYVEPFVQMVAGGFIAVFSSYLGLAILGGGPAVPSQPAPGPVAA